jgi:hypothetical protein
MGALPTARCWVMRCPACCEGWCALLPAGRGYRIAPIGCSSGCDPLETEWWHLWRTGLLPPPIPIEADAAARRYVTGAIRHAAHRIASAGSLLRQLGQLRHEAQALAALAAGEGVELAQVARALAAAARHLEMPAGGAASAIRLGLIAGAARPRRRRSAS